MSVAVVIGTLRVTALITTAANDTLKIFIIPHHTIVVRYYSFQVGRPSVRQSVVRPYISFPDDNLNINGFSPKLVYAFILLRSGLGLLMG